MKKINIGYWIFTGLTIVLIGLGAVMDALSTPDAIAVFKHLGYPLYLLPFLGIAKILGLIAILIPGLPRIKEWAYAGLVFDLSGAFYSSICSGDPLSKCFPILIGILLVFGSYYFYYQKLELQLKENF